MAGGVFLHIHKFAKPQKEGGTSRTQNVRFCDLQTCGSLAGAKKKDGKFANAQFTNCNCGNLGHPNGHGYVEDIYLNCARPFCFLPQPKSAIKKISILIKTRRSVALSPYRQALVPNLWQ
jgi:hypothetical protein